MQSRAKQPTPVYPTSIFTSPVSPCEHRLTYPRGGTTCTDQAVSVTLTHICPWNTPHETMETTKSTPIEYHSTLISSLNSLWQKSSNTVVIQVEQTVGASSPTLRLQKGRHPGPIPRPLLCSCKHSTQREAGGCHSQIKCLSFLSFSWALPYSHVPGQD